MKKSPGSVTIKDLHQKQSSKTSNHKKGTQNCLVVVLWSSVRETIADNERSGHKSRWPAQRLAHSSPSEANTMLDKETHSDFSGTNVEEVRMYGFIASSHFLDLDGRQGTTDDVAPTLFHLFLSSNTSRESQKSHSRPFFNVVFPAFLVLSSSYCSFHRPLKNCLHYANGYPYHMKLKI